MRKERHTPILLACVVLVASVLACNAPTPTPAPPLAGTPGAASPVPAQETPSPSATQAPPEATPTTTLPTATQAAPTETPSGTVSPTPSAAQPTSEPPVSTGPLDFVAPARLNAWQAMDNGAYEATIILNITGGAPPYTVHHDLDVFVTEETAPAIIFEARGCSALVHTISVESSDGQSVTYDYWISPPWCD